MMPVTPDRQLTRDALEVLDSIARARGLRLELAADYGNPDGLARDLSLLRVVQRDGTPAGCRTIPRAADALEVAKLAMDLARQLSDTIAPVPHR